MILTRRSLLRTAPALLLSPRRALSSPLHSRGGATGLAISLPPNGPTLTNGYGPWAWGAQVLAPGIHAPNGWFWITLNGKTVFFSGENVLAYGNQIFADFTDGNWFCYQDNYQFQINCSGADLETDICAPYGNVIPVPNVGGPFTPSPDGTAITAPTGTVTTVDGVWTWGTGTGGSNYQVWLNGVYIFHNASQMQVDSHGSLFYLKDDGNWRAWLNYAECPAVAPTASPIPVTINMTPSWIHTYSYPTGTVNTVIAAAAVTMSDGSAFSGTVSVTPDSIGFGANFLGYSGGNLVLTRNLMSGDIGAQGFDVYPSQNGVQLVSGAYLFVMGVTS
jgi:hypothetical protein